MELQGFPHIQVLMLDESNIPEYPDGWELWAKLIRQVVPESISAIFGGEPEYAEQYGRYFPEAEYVIYDYMRDRYPVSGTKVRMDPLKYWDYILGVARPHFVKRVLLTGTESCGKTTLTKYLAKIYHTSWAEEEGRYYAERYLGGNEAIFTKADFLEIVHQQIREEEHAKRTANKVTFLDTDAVVTQYYCRLYLGGLNYDIEPLIDPDRYDLILMFTPDVQWVPDGSRWNSEGKVRWELHDKLKAMYMGHGFGDKLVEVAGDYQKRLETAIGLVDKLLQDKAV
jgi:HTH-type transcriptional repressor of NAD biosynthesis genes